MQAASNVPLTIGDIVRIPVGEGHTIRPVGDAPLVYVIIKVKSRDDPPCGSLTGRGQKRHACRIHALSARSVPIRGKAVHPQCSRSAPRSTRIRRQNATSTVANTARAGRTK